MQSFDVIENGGSGLGAGLEVAPVDQFKFEGAPEAFQGGVVVVIALAVHGVEGGAEFASGLHGCRFDGLDHTRFCPISLSIISRQAHSSCLMAEPIMGRRHYAFGMPNGDELTSLP